MSLPLNLPYPIPFSINRFPAQAVTGIPKQASALCILLIRRGTSSSMADKREENWIDPHQRANRAWRWRFLDQIVSDQSVLIPQMSGFITSHILWGCTTFVDPISDYVYVHLMRDLSLSEMLLGQRGIGKTDGTSRVNRQALSRWQWHVLWKWFHLWH